MAIARQQTREPVPRPKAENNRPFARAILFGFEIEIISVVQTQFGFIRSPDSVQSLFFFCYFKFSSLVEQVKKHNLRKMLREKDAMRTMVLVSTYNTFQVLHGVSQRGVFLLQLRKYTTELKNLWMCRSE